MKLGGSMNFIIKDMDENLARKIISWVYEEPYDFYNNVLNEEVIKEYLDGSYRAIIDDDEVFGFLCTGQTAQIPAGIKYGVYNDKFVDMGLGMNPDYVGIWL